MTAGQFHELLRQRKMRDLPRERQHMCARIAGLGVASRIVHALDAVPRQAFVPSAWWRLAYAESGLWLPSGSTLPAPEATARILAALDPAPGERLLEIGTGAGYVAALLSQLAESVLTVDAVDRTDGVLDAAQFEGLRRLYGPEAANWESEAPFDAILLSQPVPMLPVEMLACTARLVAVVGLPGGPQRLLLARPGEGGREVRIRDHGPLVVPSAAMATAATGGVPLAVPLEGIEGAPGAGA